MQPVSIALQKQVLYMANHMPHNASMLVRIAAICFIFLSTCVAWLFLGATINSRTSDSRNSLDGKMETLWGGEHTQRPPSVTYTIKDTGRSPELVQVIAVPVAASAMHVKLDLEHRQKGLLWYSTYHVGFTGGWSVRNDSTSPQQFLFEFPLPSKDATYDGLTFRINGELVEATPSGHGFLLTGAAGPGETLRLDCAYRSTGLGNWSYRLGEGVSRARDFVLTVHTNFAGFDFPEKTLAPGERTRADGGWDLKWRYDSLVSGFPIRVEMPRKLQPGPLAAEISYFAPVSLFFFFFLLWLGTTVKGIDIHPMHFFFLAASFFAFHLLLAYLVDHISVHLAFVICALVSMGLVGSYLRRVDGVGLVWREAVAGQLLYLVLFSYAFFFIGYTGLAITAGAILTLFVSMQATAKVNWAERFRSIGDLGSKPPVLPGLSS